MTPKTFSDNSITPPSECLDDKLKPRLIRNKQSTGWHFAGTRMRIHYLLGQLRDDCGCLSLCNHRVNGISTRKINPKDYPQLVCKSCVRKRSQ